MKQSRIKLAQVIADRSLSKGSTRQLSRQIAAFLLTERRVGELDSLLRDVQADWAETGHVEVLVSSAHGLTAAVKRDIKERVSKLYPKARQIIITEVHQPDIIGGVRLNVVDRQLDLTIRTKLQTFKRLAAAKEQA